MSKFLRVSSGRRARSFGAIVAVIALATAAVVVDPDGAHAADPVGTVASFAPPAGSTLNNEVHAWNNELIVNNLLPGGFSAFNSTTGASSTSTITPAPGIVKTSVIFNNNLVWAEGAATNVFVSDVGGNKHPIGPVVASADSMIVVGNDLWVSSPGAVTRYPNAVASLSSPWPPLGGATALAPAPGAGTSRMAFPGPDGNVWIVNSAAGTDTISRWTAAGALVGTKNFADNNADPSAIAIGSDNAAWVIAAGKNSVIRFDASVNPVELALPAGANPSSIIGDPATGGGAWVTENGLSNVSRLAFASGAITRTAYFAQANGFGLKGLTIGPDQNVWAVGANANKLAKFGSVAPTPTTTTSTTIAPATTTTLASTTTVAATTTVVATTTTAATTPVTLAPVTTAAPPISVVVVINNPPAKTKTRVCIRTARRRVKVGKKFVTRTVCTRYRRAV